MAGMSTLDALTPRQQQILELVGAGKTNREIAGIVGISENTVEYHLNKRIFPRLGVRNRSAAADVYRTTRERATRQLRESVVPEPASIATMNATNPFIKEIDMTIPQGIELGFVQTLEDAQRALDFAEAHLGPLGPRHSRERYNSVHAQTPSLLIVAKQAGAIVGCALGGIDDDHVLVGPVAVSQPLRQRGIGRAMMTELERQTRAVGHNTLILGSAEDAEAFYLKCGYQPNLFVQLPDAAALPKLKTVNHDYAVAWEAAQDGWSKLMLRTPRIDRALQRRFESAFPACHTQTVFIKSI